MAHMLEGADVRACRVYDGPLDLRRRQKLVDQKAVPLEKLSSCGSENAEPERR